MCLIAIVKCISYMILFRARWGKAKTPPYICPTVSQYEWPTRVEHPLCSLMLQVPLEDNFCLPLVCVDVGLRHDLCYPQVVLYGFGGCGAGQCGKKLLVLSVSEVCFWAFYIPDTERVRLIKIKTCVFEIASVSHLHVLYTTYWVVLAAHLD